MLSLVFTLLLLLLVFLTILFRSLSVPLAIIREQIRVRNGLGKKEEKNGR